MQLNEIPTGTTIWFKELACKSFEELEKDMIVLKYKMDKLGKECIYYEMAALNSTGLERSTNLDILRDIRLQMSQTDLQLNKIISTLKTKSL